MNDRELLTLAAKAAGIKGSWDSYASCFVPLTGQIFWDPLTSDGDAFRLAIKLHINIEVWDVEYCIRTNIFIRSIQRHGNFEEPYTDDPAAAARRCVVRAAATIGMNTK